MTATTTTLVPIQPVFSDAERLALAGFLAGYRGLTREAYALGALARAGDRPAPAALVSDALDAALRLDTEWPWLAVAALAPRLGLVDLHRVLPLLREAAPGSKVVQAAAASAVRAAHLRDEPLMLACFAVARTDLGENAVAIAADRLPSEMLRIVAEKAAQGSAALAAIAVSAAARGDHRLALETLPRITGGTIRERALIEVSERARPSWAEDLLTTIREYPEGPRAEALAKIIPKFAPERHATLVEEAVRAASHGYHLALAPKRMHVLTTLAAQLAHLPPPQLARLWKDIMRIDGLRGRDEVLVDVAALAGPLAEVFGTSVAHALDNAIQIGSGDRWP